MPEIKIHIGGREFEVVCKEGEEDFLHSAAAMLDVEATALNTAMGRIPESRMLLMSGLMLADKTASLEDQLAAAARESEGGPLAHEVSAEMDKLKADLAAANDKAASAEKALAEKTADFEAKITEMTAKEEIKAQDVTADIDAKVAELTTELEAKTADAEQKEANMHLALEAMERMVVTLEEKGA